MLSLGEQQRLGIARALLQAPDFLFLDEATASLDEPSEAALYRLLQERLPNATDRLDRPPLDAAAFHRRRLRSSATATAFACGELALQPAAEYAATSRKETGGGRLAAARDRMGLRTYLRLALTVRSAESRATKRPPHQFEPSRRIDAVMPVG